MAGRPDLLALMLALLLFLSVESAGVGDRLASTGADRPGVTVALLS